MLGFWLLVLRYHGTKPFISLVTCIVQHIHTDMTRTLLWISSESALCFDSLPSGSDRTEGRMYHMRDEAHGVSWWTEGPERLTSPSLASPACCYRCTMSAFYIGLCSGFKGSLQGLTATMHALEITCTSDPFWMTTWMNLNKVHQLRRGSSFPFLALHFYPIKRLLRWNQT